MPHIQSTVRIEQGQIVVSLSTDAAAPFVFLESPYPGRFSDNGFLLVPMDGQTKDISFISKADFSLNDFKSSLKIRSIRDTYQ